MDALTVYGAVSVTLMMLAYALESRAAFFVLAFACACLASSAYGFLQGAWPFGVVEIVWAAVAFMRWRRRTEQVTLPSLVSKRR
jgi:hypothetical protein